MHNNRHKPSYEDLLDRIAVLEARTQRLSVSPNGYLTRPALEVMLESINDRLYSPDSSLVFLGWDIDGMKQCNTTWGSLARTSVYHLYVIIPLSVPSTLARYGQGTSTCALSSPRMRLAWPSGSRKLCT